MTGYGSFGVPVVSPSGAKSFRFRLNPSRMSDDHLNSVTIGDLKRIGTMSSRRFEPKILEGCSESIGVKEGYQPGGVYQSPDVENLVLGGDAVFWGFFHMFDPSVHDCLCAVIPREGRSDGIFVEPLGVWTDFVEPFFHDGSWGIVARRKRTAGHGT